MPYATARDGVHIYYEAAGAGRAVLLMTGAFGSLEAWHEAGYVDELARDRRVILMDLRGHGRSDKPHDAAMYGWPKNATDALAVIEAEGERGVDVFGQSMGGQVTIAMLHSDTSRLRSLACNGAYPLTEPPGRPIGQLLKRAKMLREHGMAGMLLPDAGTPRLPGEEASEAYLQRVRDGDVDAYVAEAEGQAPMDDQWLAPDGPPMLFVATEHDPVAIATCKDLPTKYPYALYLYLPGESHFITRKREKFLPILREFWGSVGG
jgi:pimeloyl-ACP methyl ester carboxylesterase